MLRPVRKLLIASLVALHAAVMLCGPCLHGLAGVGNHATIVSGGVVAHQARDAFRPSHDRPDDCPVCHFLAQAQMSVDSESVSIVQRVCLIKPEIPFDSLTPSLPSSGSPRAPPFGVACLS